MENERKNIPYIDKSYVDKRRILREYSIKDQIRYYVATIADACINPNNDGNFCYVNLLTGNYSKYNARYQEIYKKIYNKFGFSDGITAWQTMKEFLVDGYLAFEIVYDINTNYLISGFNRLSPDTLVPSYEKGVGNIWIQYPEDLKLRREFLDSQIIFISYSAQNDETSYVESLIKPYNQLRIIEQTKIMFSIINSTVYQKFTIPTKGLSKGRAEEQIGQLIANYSEHVEWDDTLGTLSINGNENISYNKQIWLPEGDYGTNNMEILGHQNMQSADDTQLLNYFGDSLRKASKIEPENPTMLETRRFVNFTNRVKSTFKEIILKPLKIQMCIEFPELKDDEEFANSVNIIFNN